MREKGVKRQFFKWPLRVLGAAGLLLLMVLGAAWWQLRSSLPMLDGHLVAPGLAAPVDIERDAMGVPTITGANRTDVAFATGFVHAQDRYFQMDLLRRTATGELSELFGAGALDADRRRRQHRFRARAAVALQALAPADRALLQRYAEGVNAGLSALPSPPFEYTVLRSEPARWEASDTLLVVWAMYLDLQGHLPGRELARGWLKEHSSAAALAFLLPETSEYDTPLDGARPLPREAIPAQGPDWLAQPVTQKSAAIPAEAIAGSNNWAIAGTRTRGGGAIVANDMHLGLMLPNTWYRAQLRFPAQAGGMRRITGVTLPGAPLIIIGSNGDVAWGFTNSAGDYRDFLSIERDPVNALKFKVAGVSQTATEYRETLRVRGGEPQAMTVLQIGEAPIVQVGDRFYLEHWVAHKAGAVNLGLQGLESVQTVDAALAVANRAGVPAQNFTAGDRGGSIGWTIVGAIPARDADASRTFPLPSGADAGEWKNLRAADAYPRLLNPASGLLWTANNQQLSGDGYRAIGDGGADLGARARQIRDDLAGLDARSDEKASLAIQLDDRALFMSAWRDRALRTLDAAAVAGQPQRLRMRELLAQRWTGRASADSQGYRLARLFFLASYTELFGALDAELKKLNPRASYASANMRWPVVVGRLLDEKPPHWLPAPRSWRDVELAAIDRAIRQAVEESGSLDAATWGAGNVAGIRHPMAAFLPVVGRFLSAPPDPLPGDDNMPRVSAASFGASERMVVTPGREQDGILNMPGGQSGHPLSPFFLAGHSDWVQGRPTPFLPGAPQHTVRLLPR